MKEQPTTKAMQDALKREARISCLPNVTFPYWIYYYQPGCGFDAGHLVYVGKNQYRTLQEAQEAKAKWESV